MVLQSMIARMQMAYIQHSHLRKKVVPAHMNKEIDLLTVIHMTHMILNIWRISVTKTKMNMTKMKMKMKIPLIMLEGIKK